MRARREQQITVAMIDQAWKDLWVLQERTGLSATDVINRAISVYEFVDRQTTEGHEVLVRDKQTGEQQILDIQ